ncbi:MAG: hypothetical protein E2O42_08470 [Nitrospina sp.]|nr:MAG: hypothetical protein E2O43_07095 [Nitrospina sp.]TDJ58452.1 MAG: hypothetical protein E2O42_08470 [Nitrospina sp.]
MATLEQLKTHISTTQTKLEEAQKKAGDAKYDLDVRKIRKKYKRLTRKAGKIVYMEKKKNEKGKKKKGGE